MGEGSGISMLYREFASSDAVVTKIGYTTFVEAACNGVGIVSAPRADWPEFGPRESSVSHKTHFKQ